MNQPTADHHQSVGRRKEAVARVRLFPGQAQITVNGKPISDYFKGHLAQKRYQKPFELTKTLGKFTGTVKVLGGGTTSQLDAVVHGIAKALEKANKEVNRIPLKRAGLLTRDSRVKERRKYGLAHAARAKKQSPKR
jgi:small subunit ribosomal protein S9